MKKSATEGQAAVNGTISSWSISHARVTKAGVYFSLNINGVEINNCRVVETKNSDFISLPQYKGSDGNWYNVVYFRFSKEDQDAILDAIEKTING